MNKKIIFIHGITGFMLMKTLVIFCFYISIMMSDKKNLDPNIVLVTEISTWLSIGLYPLIIAYMVGKRGLEYGVINMFDKEHETLEGYFIGTCSAMLGIGVCITITSYLDVRLLFPGMVIALLLIIVIVMIYYRFVRFAFREGAKNKK